MFKIDGNTDVFSCKLPMSINETYKKALTKTAGSGVFVLTEECLFCGAKYQSSD